MKHSLAVAVLAVWFLLIGGSGQVWAIDWGGCQRTHFSELKPEIVIPACSQIIKTGQASQADLATAHYRRARGYDKQEDLDLAFEDFNKAIELNADLAQAYHSRGVAHLEAGNVDRAETDFLEVLIIDSDHAGPPWELGWMHFDRGELQTALADFSSAIEASPDDHFSFWARGLVYMAKGNFEEAVTDCTKVIEASENPAISDPCCRPPRQGREKRTRGALDDTFTRPVRFNQISR